MYAHIPYTTSEKGKPPTVYRGVKAADGSLDSVPCVTFSQDTSLMAAGFTESYIRLWSLKGEKLKGYRSDFQSSQVKDG